MPSEFNLSLSWCWWGSCGNERGRRFLIIFINYMSTDNLLHGINGHPNFLEPPWVVFVKNDNRPSASFWATPKTSAPALNLVHI